MKKFLDKIHEIGPRYQVTLQYIDTDPFKTMIEIYDHELNYQCRSFFNSTEFDAQDLDTEGLICIMIDRMIENITRNAREKAPVG